MAKHHAPGFLKLVDAARSQIREYTVHEVKAKLDNGDEFLIVDVREESEWAAGRLPSAVHLSKGVIERDVEKTIPDTSVEIVLYCGGGFRSALAAVNLLQMGYANVVSMDGGHSGWREAGYEIVVE